MTAPSAAVDICNLALDHCGELTITSIENPSTKTEELMARWYDQVRRTCLREYVWNFAQVYTELPRAGDGEGGYDDVYNLPNDFIRLNGVGEFEDIPVTDYQLGAGVIYANNDGDALPIRYNKSVTDVQFMDPLFINIFALRLAQKVAFKITKKKTVIEYIEGILKIEERKAVSVDGQERVPVKIEQSKYLRARRRGGSSGASRYVDFS